MRVMLVEDALGMRKLLIAMLKGMGFDEIVEVAHGGEAWEKLPLYEIDLLLTDWNMPVMDGLKLVQKIRQTPAYEDLPILMFTARSAREDVLSALQAGVDAYIAKPFTPLQLKTKIQEILGKRSRRQIRSILANQVRPNRAAEHALVVFGEKAVTPLQLSHPENREVVRFLSRAISRLRLIVSAFPELKMGYLLEGSSGSIARRLRILRDQVKMLLVSTELPGGGITLARLASINRQSSLSVFVLCDLLGEIPSQQRYGLDRLGIAVLERRRLNDEALDRLFEEYLVAPLREAVPAELPPREEIRRRLESDIRAMVALPVLPQVYHRIVALDRDPESDILQWIEAIEIDPLSQAQVIRRARSPIYGFQGEIEEISKAIILLGKNAVKELIVSGAVRRSFEGIREKGFEVEDYWRHSAAVAVTARLLSFPLEESTWTPEQRRDFETFGLDAGLIQELKRLALNTRLSLEPHQDPFIGGMMHDIGKVALVQSYPGLFPMIVEELSGRSWKVPMHQVEEEIAGGVDHALVGRLLAENWKLGDEICRLIERHHAPEPQNSFSELVALANFLGGGIYPYPSQATYPLVGLLQKGGTQEGIQSLGAEADMAEAIQPFLPEGLLERLALSLEDLIGLGRLLIPVVRRLVEELRRST